MILCTVLGKKMEYAGEVIQCSQKKILVIDEFDVTGGIFEVSCIDNYLSDYRSLNPIGKLVEAVGK